MNSEKVKEIKEALECWQESVMLSTDENYVSHKVYNREILDYINELESENAELTNAVLDNLDAYRDGFNAGASLKDRVDNKLKNENQQLKDRIAELEKEKTCVWEEWTDGDHSIWCCSNCKEDFCFLEGDVYENNYGYCPHCGAKITALKELKEDDIDETLKEFIDNKFE